MQLSTAASLQRLGCSFLGVCNQPIQHQVYVGLVFARDAVDRNFFARQVLHASRAESKQVPVLPLQQLCLQARLRTGELCTGHVPLRAKVLRNDTV